MLSNFKHYSRLLSFGLGIGLLAFWACKKGNEKAIAEIFMPQTETLQQGFNRQGLSAQLHEPSGSDTLFWQPNWGEAQEQVAKGKTYTFVRLRPVLLHSGTVKPVTTLSFQQYLIILKTGDTTKYYRAKYIDEAYRMRVGQNRDTAINFGRFMGIRILDDFSGHSWSTEHLGLVNRLLKKPQQGTFAREVCDNLCSWFKWCERGPWVLGSTGYFGSNCPMPQMGNEEIDCGIQGTGGGWTLVSSTYVNCHNTDDNIDPLTFPNLPGTVGGDGGVVPFGTSYVRDITSRLTDSCYISGLNTAMRPTTTGGGLKENLKRMINRMFNTADVFNLEFEQEALKDLQGNPITNVDAITRMQKSMAGGQVNTKITITYNTNAMKSPSMEYFVSATNHELWHAFMKGEGLTMFEYMEHEDMADKYVYEMTVSLIATFPTLTYIDASDLAWAGLQQTAAWRKFAAQFPSVATKTLDNIFKYHYSIKGTKCQ